MNEQKPRTALDLIDEAVAAAKHAAHSCRNELAREHFEFALALLTESWIAEDGQDARPVAQVIADVREGMDLFALVFSLPSSPLATKDRSFSAPAPKHRL
jgi:hypothetical protein